MDNPILTLPDPDDETVVKLNDFFYELLEVFESHYAYQILRYNRILRTQQGQYRAGAFLEEEDEEPDSNPF